jgi:predicted Rossmann fold flavoprotein
MVKSIAIIGGGAAGFFSAIHAKENYPDASVVIFEKTHKLLAKVKISGGGRCNVTNACDSISELCKAYPRGGKQLKKAFHIFNTRHTFAWFESKGVHLKIEEDGRIFPTSDNSQTIIDCLINETKRLQIEIVQGITINNIQQTDDRIELNFANEIRKPELFDKVIVASGGSPKREGLEWLERLHHKIEDPVPSLFTFNMPSESITGLMGVTVKNAIATIQGTNLKSEGPLLITHWGMSGPAILKLSAYGARILNEMNYEFNVRINWVNESNHELVWKELENIVQLHPKKLISSVKPYFITERLWIYLIEKCDIHSEKTWESLGKKNLHKLINILTNDVYAVRGKTTFKEEFVTCGGVSLESIDLNTMQSKVCKNLYFAGEILDIDAITGGYNFQAAWTTGFIAGGLKN